MPVDEIVPGDVPVRDDTGYLTAYVLVLIVRKGSRPFMPGARAALRGNGWRGSAVEGVLFTVGGCIRNKARLGPLVSVGTLFPEPPFNNPPLSARKPP
jgi:hypothetical protein